jgi:hypothetical protein
MLSARDRAVRNEFLALSLLAGAHPAGRAGTEVVVGTNTVNPPYGSTTAFYQTSRRVRNPMQHAGGRSKFTYILNMHWLGD